MYFFDLTFTDFQTGRQTLGIILEKTIFLDEKNKNCAIFDIEN
jgi:hypothetical protein